MRGVCSSCQSVQEMEYELKPGGDRFLEFLMDPDDAEMSYHWVLEGHSFYGEPCPGSGMYPEAILPA